MSPEIAEALADAPNWLRALAVVTEATAFVAIVLGFLYFFYRMTADR